LLASKRSGMVFRYPGDRYGGAEQKAQAGENAETKSRKTQNGGVRKRFYRVQAQKRTNHLNPGRKTAQKRRTAVNAERRYGGKNAGRETASRQTSAEPCLFKAGANGPTQRRSKV